MMKMSKRARRMDRNHALSKEGRIDLVSMMDIFTILVFFLLVSSSGVKPLPSHKDIKLPSTIAEKSPAETLIVIVTKKDILVQDRFVAHTADVIVDQKENIPLLVEELKFQSKKSKPAKLDRDKGYAVTIMGDENLPYELLRKVLASCRQANYTRIAFAANQKAKSKA